MKSGGIKAKMRLLILRDWKFIRLSWLACFYNSNWEIVTFVCWRQKRKTCLFCFLMKKWAYLWLILAVFKQEEDRLPRRYDGRCQNTSHWAAAAMTMVEWFGSKIKRRCELCLRLERVSGVMGALVCLITMGKWWCFTLLTPKCQLEFQK